MKGMTDRVISNEEIIETLWNFVKLRKGDFLNSSTCQTFDC
jgi:hypothetical protein